MKSSEAFRFYFDSPLRFIMNFAIENIYSNIEFEKLNKSIKEIKTGKTPSKRVPEYYDSNDFNWFKPEDVGKYMYLNESKDKLSNNAIGDNKATIYAKNTILMTGIGDIGRLGILKNESSSNQQITGILMKDNIIPEYTYFFLLSRKDKLEGHASSTTLPILNQKKIKDLKFKVLLREEQKKLSNYLIYCMNCLNEKILPDKRKFELPRELYDFAIKSFKVYYGKNIISEGSTFQNQTITKLRRSILQEAVDGELVENYPKEQLGKYIKITGGFAFKSFEYKSKGIPIIRISNFNNEKIDLSNVKYYKEKSEYDRYQLYEGDIIITLTGGTIGKLGIVQKGLGKLYLNQRVGKFSIRNPKKFYNKYIYYITKCIQEKIKNMGYGGAQPNISGKQIEEMEFSIPNKKIQKEIVEKCDRLMVICDELGEQVKENKKNSGLLMDAILRESFEIKVEK